MMFKSKKKLAVLFTVTALMFLTTVNTSVSGISDIVDESVIIIDRDEVPTPSRPSFEDLPPLVDSPINVEIFADWSGVSSSGNGIDGDPFIIENKYINATSLSYGIRIADVGSYFEIRNCVVLAGDSGIMLESLSAGTGLVHNNILVNNSFGINVILTTGHRLQLNEIYGQLNGIRTFFGNAQAYNNTITDCDIGISMSTSSSGEVYYNNISYCGDGVAINSINNMYIQHNNVTYCDDAGITLSNCNNPQVRYNTVSFNYDGIEVYTCTDGVIGNNYCYDNEQSGISVRYTEAIELWFNYMYGDGLNVYDTNYTRMATLDIRNDNNYVNDKLLQFIVEGEYVTLSGDYGQVIALNCSSYHIESIQFSNVNVAAVSIINCSLTQVEYCEFTDCYVGVLVTESFNVFVRHNTFENNSFGLFSVSTLNTVASNCSYMSNLIGVYFAETGYGSIKFNNFFNNSNFGAALEASSMNVIYYNNFVDNGPGGLPQAADYDGIANLWYSSSDLQGNYWSDLGANSTYLIFCLLDDIFDLYPLSSVVVIVPEFESNKAIVAFCTIVTFFALIHILKKRK